VWPAKITKALIVVGGKGVAREQPGVGNTPDGNGSNAAAIDGTTHSNVLGPVDP
jgi:hypothetical protein